MVLFHICFRGLDHRHGGGRSPGEEICGCGLLYGPLCPAYGFGGVAYAIFLTELKEHLFFLFLGGAILCFLLTLLTGFVLERIFHRKWWDYSRKRFQFGGYVNLPYAVVWGVLAVFAILFVNPFLRRVIRLIPRAAGEIILLVLVILALLDLAGTLTGILKVKSHVKKQSLLYGAIRISISALRSVGKSSEDCGYDGKRADPAGPPAYGTGPIPL